MGTQISGQIVLRHSGQTGENKSEEYGKFHLGEFTVDQVLRLPTGDFGLLVRGVRRSASVAIAISASAPAPSPASAGAILPRGRPSTAATLLHHNDERSTASTLSRSAPRKGLPLR